MKGPAIDKLSVYKQIPQQSNQLLWRMTGEQGDKWKKALISTNILNNTKVCVKSCDNRC